MHQPRDILYNISGVSLLITQEGMTMSVITVMIIVPFTDVSTIYRVTVDIRSSPRY